MVSDIKLKLQTKSLSRFAFVPLFLAVAVLSITPWNESAFADHGLPEVPGFEAGRTLVQDNCLVCHTADRFTDKIRSVWDFTVDRMEDKQGYPTIHTPEEQEAMVDYIMEIHGLDAPIPNIGDFITLSSLANGFTFPLAVKHAGDGTGWLYIVEQDGTIQIFDGTQVLPTPFLDISAMVTSGGEQGLLDVAFHPDYINNGFFYVHFNDLNGDTVIARYTRGVDPAQADPLSAFLIFTTDQTLANHNGGQLEFGPDGNLYLALGDGGVPGNTGFNTAQDLDSYLGKILRFDVDGGSPYAIPPDNPFISDPNALPEIWAYGLRNPFRLSFDRETGDLFISDVGNDTLEEVNFEPAGDPGGHNYGWPIMEATLCTVNPGCNDGSLTLPILAYDHNSGDCSVIGGYRHRGTLSPKLEGIYFYGDLCSGKLRGATQQPTGEWQSQVLLDTQNTITSLGEDEDGNLYVLDFTGILFRIDQNNTPKLINDFDGNDESDLLIHNSLSGDVIVALLSGGTIQSGNLVTGLNAAGGETINATGDFNGDKKADILSYNTVSGEIKTLLMDGTNLVSTNGILTIDPLSNFVVQGTGDFDGNGIDEIVVHNPVDGMTAFLYLDATGTAFDRIELATDVDIEGDWTLNNTGDFNGDGKDDLLLYNTDFGGLLIIFMDGSNQVSFSSILELDPASGWIVRDTADFNSDGRTDLLLLNTVDGQTATVTLNGPEILAITPLYPMNLAEQETLINVSDYNADGIVDLMTHSLTTFNVKVIFLDGQNGGFAIQDVIPLDPASGFAPHSGKP